jgi:NSS family neurotransmitter:Na+ symporter
MALSGGSEHTWSSGTAFILAAVGAAVGLGNIWKFPYVVGVSGGGAFVLVYVLCVVLIAVPILIGEILIGRLGGKSPPIAMADVAEDSGRSRSWTVVGWMGMITGFLIATFYTVIAGWTLAYIIKAATGFGDASPANVADQFDELLASPGTLILWQTVFLFFTMFIVARGLQGGIEKAVKFLMPSLFVMLLVMIGYAVVAGDFAAGWNFLFSFDFSKIVRTYHIDFLTPAVEFRFINGPVVLAAIGQAFFSIGVAMGLMMVYGSYVPKNVSITKASVIIAGADTLVAILAGLMIFPIVFANGLDPAEGPGLIFKTLPTAFAAMPGGALFGAVFFLLLAFAAITSNISIIEPIVAYGRDRWGWNRVKGCTVFGAMAWLIGILSVLSFNLWDDVFPLGFFKVFERMTFFGLIDYFTANLLMPLGGILIALFVGWDLKKEHIENELSFGSPLVAQVWLVLIRVVAPAAILWVLIDSLNIVDGVKWLWALLTG